MAMRLDEEDFQTQIKQNEQIYAILAATEGIKASTPREIRHFLKFNRSIDRDRCIFQFRNSDYEIRKIESMGSLILVASHIYSPADMDSISMEFLRIASEFNGEYDGWETQILDTLFN